MAGHLQLFCALALLGLGTLSFLHAQVELSVTPTTVMADLPRHEWIATVEVASAANLHSLQFDLLFPDRVQRLEGFDQTGAFLTSAGGSVVKLIDPLPNGIRVSLALLGTAHDVSGGGPVFQTRLRMEDVPQTPRQVTLANVTLNATDGSAIPANALNPMTLASSHSPRLTLESTVTVITEASQQVNVSIVGHDLVELHSFALDLPYQSTALSHMHTTEGTFLTSGGGTSVFLPEDKGDHIHIASALLGTGNEVSGTGTLATVRFSATSLSQLPTTLNVASLGMKDAFATDWAPSVVAESLTLLPASVDQDGDGLLDSWEMDHFDAIDDPRAQPHLDIDGDGHTNLFEYIAGLDPKDNASRFRVEVRTPDTGSGMWIGYTPMQRGRTYTIEWTDLQTPVQWDDVTPAAEEDADGLHWIRDNAAGDRRIYRVKIQLP
jgi:hypothetical protein